jgi:hypothetical protein
MIGQRIFPDKYGHLRLPEGGYGRDLRGRWFCRPPRCNTGSLQKHDVIEHADGTITVTPSILITQHPLPQWHGFLERGVWREV